jgi:hypothetical protein
MGSSDSQPSSVPFIQLLVYVVTSPGSLELPPGGFAYMQPGTLCATEYSEFTEGNGRWILPSNVSLPSPYYTANPTSAMTSTTVSTDITAHTHPFTSTIILSSGSGEGNGWG